MLREYVGEELRRYLEATPWAKDLIGQAIAARHHAHAPYSRFPVGAALRARRGDAVITTTGVNIENSIYVDMHAEQVAIARFILEHGDDRQQPIHAIAVALLATRDRDHALPCGLCRQWIREFGSPGTTVIGAKISRDGATEPSAIEMDTLDALLPYAFAPENLPRVRTDP